MTPSEAYRTFLAVKRHFAPGSTYDYHKYCGKVNVRASTFEAHPQRYYFEKLARVRDPVGFLVANLSEKPSLWIGEMFCQEADDRYARFNRVVESLTYTVKTEMARLPEDDFDSNFVFKNGDHPPALVSMTNGEVSPEVLAALDAVVGFTRHWEKFSWDPTVRQAVARIRKLRGFLEYDGSQIASEVVRTFSERANAA